MKQEESSTEKPDNPPKKMWITDIIVLTLLASGIFFIYQYNSQTERIEMELQKNRNAQSQPLPKADGKK